MNANKNAVQYCPKPKDLERAANDPAAPDSKPNVTDAAGSCQFEETSRNRVEALGPVKLLPRQLDYGIR